MKIKVGYPTELSRVLCTTTPPILKYMNWSDICFVFWKKTILIKMRHLHGNCGSASEYSGIFIFIHLISFIS